MSGYRCSNCRNLLEAGILFCPKCDRYFGVPVPDGTPPDANAALFGTYNGTGYRVRTATAFGIAALTAVTLLGVLFANGTFSRMQSHSSSKFASDAQILDSVSADESACESGTFTARLGALDKFIGMASHCTPSHTNANGIDDTVVIICKNPTTPEHAKWVGRYAAHIYSDVRQVHMSRKDAMKVKVQVCDVHGHPLALIVGTFLKQYNSDGSQAVASSMDGHTPAPTGAHGPIGTAAH